MTRTQAAFYPHFLEPSLVPGEELTPTELQVLHLLCADKSNAEIAQIMDVKLPTVKTHVSHILDKLDVKRRAEARTAAKKRRLIPDALQKLCLCLNGLNINLIHISQGRIL